MIKRYALNTISDIFSDENKLSLWQETELAVILARVRLDKIDHQIYKKIKDIWRAKPIDLDWWKKRDEEIHHDLNAFLDERYRHLPAELHCYVHKNITSYDTEEAAFATMLKQALEVVDSAYLDLSRTLRRMAIKYRYTIMNARTHGQEAEMQSFGARILSWFKDLKMANELLTDVRKHLIYSKLSGAIGKYGSINPLLEKKALQILGFKPYYGATQIMPRIIYAPIAQALSNMALVIDKIANDIRLSSRSGSVLMQEPFKKKQKGSSTMPHKKNPINSEQNEGLGKMAVGYMIMITTTIKTWEERSIEQSSVERVAWPDLFHITVRALNVLNKVLTGLKVYPDNMLKEIYESRGVYASSEAKEFLKEQLKDSGLCNEDIYRIVQLAAFNAFEPSEEQLSIREKIPENFSEAQSLLIKIESLPKEAPKSIRDIIAGWDLKFTDELDITKEQVDKYNSELKKLFQSKKGLINEWDKLFSPEFLLKNEKILYQEILGIK
jgi:adenylosuccinate lyase